MTNRLATQRIARQKLNAPRVELPAPEPVLNAFQSVRPRGQDAPTQTPPAKRGPKSTTGTGLALNISGKRQAPLTGRASAATSIIPTKSWKETNDKIKRIGKANI